MPSDAPAGCHRRPAIVAGHAFRMLPNPDFRLLNEALLRQHARAFRTDPPVRPAIGKKDQEET
ncbi:MAG TPA: hypothetical protein VMF05_00465 [Stellaceae bacterium]|nr:hypothetical protein [Stellaceae bacterium]